MDLAKKLIQRYIEHDVGQIGGQLAYFSLLSIFPFIVFINKLIVTVNLSYGEALDGFLNLFLKKETADYIITYVGYISNSYSPRLMPVGIITLIYSASRIVRSMEKAINTAYEVELRRGFFRSLLRSMLFIVCFGIIILLMLAASVFSHNILQYIFSFFRVEEKFVQSLIIVKWFVFILVGFFAMTAIYYFIPYKKVSFKSTFPGAMAAIVAFTLFSAGFGLYVGYGLKNSVLYGSIGVVFLLLLWLYFTGIIIVMGAELNSILFEANGE